MVGVSARSVMLHSDNRHSENTRGALEKSQMFHKVLDLKIYLSKNGDHFDTKYEIGKNVKQSMTRYRKKRIWPFSSEYYF